MKNIVAIIILCLSLSSCLKLDDMAFLGDTSITAYEFDNYEGNTDMELPEKYNIPDSMLNLMVLNGR